MTNTTTNPSKPEFLGPILIILGVGLWPLSDSLVKYLYQNNTGHIHLADSMLTIIMYAMFFRGLFLYIGTNIRYYKVMPLDPTKRFWKHPAFGTSLLRGITSFVSTVCILMAIQYLSLLQAMAIFYIAPLIASIFAPFIIGQPFTRTDFISIIGGVIGVAIIMDPALTGGDENLITGYSYALIGMVFGAFYMLLCRKYRQGHQSVGLRATGVIYMVGGFFAPIIISIIGHPVGTLFQAPHYLDSMAGSHMAIFAIAVITGVLGISMGQIGFKYTNLFIGGLLGYMELVWCWVLDYSLFGIIVDSQTLLGIGCIVGGGLYGLYANKNRS